MFVGNELAALSAMLLIYSKSVTLGNLTLEGNTLRSATRRVIAEQVRPGMGLLRDRFGNNAELMSAGRGGRLVRRYASDRSGIWSPAPLRYEIKDWSCYPSRFIAEGVTHRAHKTVI